MTAAMLAIPVACVIVGFGLSRLIDAATLRNLP